MPTLAFDVRPQARSPQRRSAPRRVAPPARSLARRGAQDRSDALAPLLARAVRDRGPIPHPADPMLARVRHGGMAMGQLRWGKVRDWEKAVDASQDAAATAAAAVLEEADAAAFLKLLLYKLNKHVNDAAKSFRYAASVSEDLQIRAMKRAIVLRQPDALPHLIGFFRTFWTKTRAAARAFVSQNPAEFMAVAIPAMLKRSAQTPDPLHIITLMDMLRDAELLRGLDDDSRRRLIAAFPLLSIGRRAATPGRNTYAITDAIFKMVIDGTLQVDYIATTPRHFATPLLVAATPDLAREDFTKLDCHRLASLFTELVKATPGMDLVARKAVIHEPILVRRRSEMPDGLVRRDYPGNVFDDDGTLTGQIFFSSGLESDSHTYSVVGGRAYDPLFGTRGTEVADSVVGYFQTMKDAAGKTVSGAWKERDADRYILKTARPLAVQQHGFSSAYVVTTDPARHGLVVAGWEVHADEEDRSQRTRGLREAAQALDPVAPDLQPLP